MYGDDLLTPDNNHEPSYSVPEATGDAYNLATANKRGEKLDNFIDNLKNGKDKKPEGQDIKPQTSDASIKDASSSIPKGSDIGSTGADLGAKGSEIGNATAKGAETMAKGAEIGSKAASTTGTVYVPAVLPCSRIPVPAGTLVTSSSFTTLPFTAVTT